MGFGAASGACGSWARLAFPPRKIQQKSDRQGRVGAGRACEVAAVMGAGGQTEVPRRKASGHWCLGQRGDGRSSWQLGQWHPGEAEGQAGGEAGPGSSCPGRCV